MNELQNYIAENEPRFLEELFSLIRIPSVSAHPERRPDIERCAERWRELLLQAGCDRAEVMPSAGNPLVYAEKMVAADAPTVLVYAHYDVMPAEPLDLWHSDPFEPEVRDGHIWARGADDDKGQSFIQVKAFEYLVRNDLLRHNVKFIFEGEEEIGSPSLAAFLTAHRELLRSDVILVSDTSMLAPELPSLTSSESANVARVFIAPPTANSKCRPSPRSTTHRWTTNAVPLSCTTISFSTVRSPHTTNSPQLGNALRVPTVAQNLFSNERTAKLYC